MTLRVRPFPAGLAVLVSSWAGTAGEVLMWCGLAAAPVPAGQIEAWADEDGVQPFGLYRDEQLVGYGELWVDDDEAEVELARLIVDPRERGQGLGRYLVAELAGRARSVHPLVFLRVHPANLAAQRCYAAAGFQPVTPEQAAEWNTGQPVALSLVHAGHVGGKSSARAGQKPAWRHGRRRLRGCSWPGRPRPDGSDVDAGTARTDAQAAFRQELRSFTKAHGTSQAVRALLDDPAGYDPAVWELMAKQLGLPGLIVGEEHGGSGAGAAEAVIALEELGAVLLPSPFLPTLLGTVAVLAGGRATAADPARGRRRAAAAGAGRR